MNNGIVGLSIKITLRNPASQQPLTPVFSVRVDDATAGPGVLRFACNGFGDVNADLLKEILQKVIESYPLKPISLYVSGGQILSEAQGSPAPADSRSLEDTGVSPPAGGSPAAIVKAAAPCQPR